MSPSFHSILTPAAQELLANPGGIGAHVSLVANFCRLQGDEDAPRFAGATKRGVCGASIEATTLRNIISPGGTLYGKPQAKFLARIVNRDLGCFANTQTAEEAQHLMGLLAMYGRVETNTSVAWAAHIGAAAPAANPEDEDAPAPFDKDDPDDLADAEAAKKAVSMQPHSPESAARLEKALDEQARVLALLFKARTRRIIVMRCLR